jgi:hypothetical protein
MNPRSLYIRQVFAKVLRTAVAQVENASPGPIEPQVAPDDAPIFADSLMIKLEMYRQKILDVKDFEAFSNLLDEILVALQLNPVSDRTKLASVLNRIRVNQGLVAL